MGETFARVTGICIEYVIAPRLPKLPTYERLIPTVDNAIIKPSDDFEFHAWPLFILTDEEIERFALPYAHKLWVYGYISYVDFLNFPHEHRFCRRWDPTSIFGSPTGFVSSSSMPKESQPLTRPKPPAATQCELMEHQHHHFDECRDAKQKRANASEYLRCFFG